MILILTLGYKYTYTWALYVIYRSVLAVGVPFLLIEAHRVFVMVS